ELDLSYPVYSLDDTHLLPTPVRLHANPRYTGRGVTLAFLDSGFYPHPDLAEPDDRIRGHIDATLLEPVEKPAFRRAEPTSWPGPAPRQPRRRSRGCRPGGRGGGRQWRCQPHHPARQRALRHHRRRPG